MPRLDGVEATRLLAGARRTRPRVIVLTTFDLDEYAFAAIKAGAAAFLLKDAAPPELLHAIRVGARRRRRGRAEHHPAAARALRARAARPDRPDGRPAARRRSPSASCEVLALVGRGRSNQEIAAELVRRRGHREDPRRPAARQDRLPRPGPARRPRLRDRRRGLTGRVRPRSHAGRPGSARRWTTKWAPQPDDPDARFPKTRGHDPDTRRPRPPGSPPAPAGLTKTYGHGDAAVHALRGVDVDLPAGRFTAIMGPSGSGKSTLMHCLAGLDQPTAGTVTVAGTALGVARRRRADRSSGASTSASCSSPSTCCRC